MRVVFLLSRYTFFFENVIVKISENKNVTKIIVVYWINDHLPVEPSITSNKIHFVRRDLLIPELLFSNSTINLVYLPGWMDKGYLKIVKKYKAKDYKLITCIGIDDQWHWSLRQIIGVFVFKLLWKNLIDFAWIAGAPQYMYARMFGFSSSKIGYNLLSSGFTGDIDKIKIPSDKLKFIFVGRLVKEKNLLTFLSVFNNMNIENITLDIIGDGYLMEKLKSCKFKNVNFLGYQPPEVVSHLLKSSDIFVLPSIHEQWSVALHEAMSYGLVGLVSKNVGANSEFLIEGYNGYSFDPKNCESIRKAIEKINSHSPEKILEFKKASYKLSQRINVEISSFSFLSFESKIC